ncbi:tetratricopeptide repeat protein [Rhodopirellula sp. MGV]|uniref:tetratricopeptide repeat protein n=1 Tax=Rhodopirellula sp. MGV TaxID=2023130 RepID=UPI000B961BB0|nr:tetratricopeptide repeat protein [Rhodopirellula sp. MGV]OYP31041.1 hypothetical protein CGZ80_21970 [Rhodopirellula sp. MGV]PNY34612.1 hypothetical protein C2E31_21735 [Rhodopirellula baltica]
MRNRRIPGGKTSCLKFTAWAGVLLATPVLAVPQDLLPPDVAQREPQATVEVYEVKTDSADQINALKVRMEQMVAESEKEKELVARNKTLLAAKQLALKELMEKLKSLGPETLSADVDIKRWKVIEGGKTIDRDVTVSDDVIKIEGLPADNRRGLIEQLVRQAFDLQTELQEARVRQAEINLKRVKNQLEKRKANADKIVAARIEELLDTQVVHVEAIVVGEPLDKVDSESAALLASEGWQAWRNVQSREALEKFKKALAIDPDLDQARNGLGWAQIQTQQYTDAIKQFQELLAKNPHHSGALNGVGQALFAQNELDAAEKQFQKAIDVMIEEHGEQTAIKRGVTAAWFGLVKTLIAQGDNEHAKQWAERYLKGKPDDEQMKSLLSEANAGLEDQKLDGKE